MCDKITITSRSDEKNCVRLEGQQVKGGKQQTAMEFLWNKIFVFESQSSNSQKATVS